MNKQMEMLQKRAALVEQARAVLEHASQSLEVA